MMRHRIRIETIAEVLRGFSSNTGPWDFKKPPVCGAEAPVAYWAKAKKEGAVGSANIGDWPFYGLSGKLSRSCIMRQKLL